MDRCVFAISVVRPHNETMKTKKIESYQRRILLAVTGLSPQVVTETLYALCVVQKPNFIPTEIHILTTTEGAEHGFLIKNLLAEEIFPC